jgi:hypothetical protein
MTQSLLKREADSLAIEIFVTLAPCPSKIYHKHVILPLFIAVTGMVLLPDEG